MENINFLNKFLEKADSYLAVTAIITCSIIVMVNHFFLSQILLFELGVTLLLTSIVYFVLKNRLNTDHDIIKPNLSLQKIKIFNVIFYILVIVINFIYHWSLYRPQIYYILLVICIGLITLDILLLRNNHQISHIIFKILIIATILRAGLFYEYPGFYGVDPWVHMFWVRIMEEVEIISMGLSGFNLLNYPPAFHLEVLTSFLVTGMGLKNSFFLSWGFIYSIGIVFIFLFTREIFGNQVALLSSVFITINQFHISWGAWLIPTSIGVVIFSLVLYLIHKKGNQKQMTIMLIILSFMAIYLHTLSPLVIVLAIAIYGLFSYFGKYFIKDNCEILNYRSFLFLLFFLAALTIMRFIYMAYASGGATFLECVLYPLKRTLEIEAGFAGGEIATHAIADYPLNRVSFMLIIAFTLFGVFLCLKKDFQSRERFGLICTLAGLMIIAYGPALMNVGNFVPGRWLVFGMVVGAPLFAVSLLSISNIPNKRLYTICICIVLIMVVTFFSINNSAVNLRTPFYEELSNDPHRWAFTHSEMQAADTLTDIYTEKFYFQHYYTMNSFNYYLINKYGADVALSLKQDVGDGSKLSITREIELHYHLNSEEVVQLISEREKNNLVYNNKYVWAVC